MPLVKTAVLLLGAAGSGKLYLRHDRLWYDHYFFHMSHGQAGYWLTQTDGERVLHGEVFDWAFLVDPSPNFSSRTATANLAIRAFEQNRGVNFDSFDVVVVVLGIDRAMQADGGSTGAKSSRRRHNAVVCRVGDPFDFVAHEIGHALGLAHSFGSNPVPVVGEKPGGYGHPFCIMSGRFYGNTASAYWPPTLRDNAREYGGLGPSLNGLTARANGWIDAHVVDLAQTAQADFTIRARQWLGRTQFAQPQGLEILSANGSNHVVDFYVREGWDLAQPGPAVVLTQGRGGRAHTHYPKENSGTYIDHVRLPVTFGLHSAALTASGFQVHLLETNPVTREVRVRVRKGSGSVPGVVLTSKVDTLATREVEAGLTTWEKGEALCLAGTWAYRKLAHSQQAVFEATYELGAPGMTAQWTIEGFAVPASPLPASGTVPLALVVDVANPKLQANHKPFLLAIEYEIEPLPNGSRLKLRNRPEDESFTLRIETTLSNSVGSGSAVGWADFEGHEYVYEPAFYEQRDGCFQRFIDVGKKYSPSKVVLFPELWEKINPVQHDEVIAWLDALADYWERGETELYHQGVDALTQKLGVGDLRLRLLSAEEAYSPPMLDREISPPAPPSVAAAVTGARRGKSSADRRVGYFLAGAAGAVLGIIWAGRRS